MPSSPVYSDSGVDFASPHRRMTNRIDSTKLKTKMCRNFLLGRPCPFEGNCAFSHDESELVEPQSPTSPQSAFRKRPSNRSAFYSKEDTVATVERELLHGDVVSESNSNSGNFAAGAPPSYREAVQDDVVNVQDEYALPPAYPTRYRNDPYSYTGVLYEQ